MVFQDGALYLDPEGEMRVPVVFDNLIHRGEMPVTIGVFVDPGEPDNRNVEYDTLHRRLRDVSADGDPPNHSGPLPRHR